MKRPCRKNGQMGLFISRMRHHHIKIALCRYIFVRRIKKSNLNAMLGRWRSNARLMAASISNLWPLSFPYQKRDRVLDAMDQRSQDQRIRYQDDTSFARLAFYLLASVRLYQNLWHTAIPTVSISNLNEKLFTKKKYHFVYGE